MAKTLSRLEAIQDELTAAPDDAQTVLLYWSDDPQPEEWDEAEDGRWAPRPFRAELEDGSLYGEGRTLAEAIDELITDLKR